jgi:hypothetical protein
VKFNQTYVTCTRIVLNRHRQVSLIYPHLADHESKLSWCEGLKIMSKISSGITGRRRLLLRLIGAGQAGRSMPGIVSDFGSPF